MDNFRLSGVPVLKVSNFYSTLGGSIVPFEDCNIWLISPRLYSIQVQQTYLFTFGVQSKTSVRWLYYFLHFYLGLTVNPTEAKVSFSKLKRIDEKSLSYDAIKIAWKAVRDIVALKLMGMFNMFSFKYCTGIFRLCVLLFCCETVFLCAG